MNSLRYSQNFIRNPTLVKKILGLSSINKNDTVIEIGAGRGIITKELASISKKVLAYEIDPALVKEIQYKFKNINNIKIHQSDFLKTSLPEYPYKVFANIPFIISSSIINKLSESNSPEEACLIIQKETAIKFTGKPLDSKNSQLAILQKPYFIFDVVYHFQRSDFSPKPNVDAVLLKILKRDRPLVNLKFSNLYKDFVVFAYNQTKPDIVKGLSVILGISTMTELSKHIGFSPNSKPSELDFKHWIALFDFFNKSTSHKQKALVEGSFNKQRARQETLVKIHRTRTDKKWKSFRKT
jgi:23S rRNA (adenine-N6)-dimethyltransferase